MTDNRADFLRQQVQPKPIQDWTPPTLRDRLVKIRAKVMSHINFRYRLSKIPYRDRIRRMSQEEASSAVDRVTDGRVAETLFGEIITIETSGLESTEGVLTEVGEGAI